MHTCVHAHTQTHTQFSLQCQSLCKRLLEKIIKIAIFIQNVYCLNFLEVLRESIATGLSEDDNHENYSEQRYLNNICSFQNER